MRIFSYFQKVDYPLELDVYDLCSEELRQKLQTPRQVFLTYFNCHYAVFLQTIKVYRVFGSRAYLSYDLIKDSKRSRKCEAWTESAKQKLS